MLKFFFGMIVGATLMVAFPNSAFRNDVKGIIKSGIVELHEAVEKHQGEAQDQTSKEESKPLAVPEAKSEEIGHYDRDGNWIPPGGFNN